ncbi:flagellar basal-body rod protein FlgF [Bacillus sp. SORGH_AS 510]|uniref:flagellar hook-basal body protein n=1 Tax=Bacillus sp. SORGH_AS_0510 TaxID=3041771 RepID=UPI00278BA3E1|nr:flagellar hook-basal body protein [Bacillus sp. SORGH_AS_0510]MDQ1146303.1 flagellar basal-body rod protein FlgF [Bacillus sp. SORGH_AS_0510]
MLRGLYSAASGMFSLERRQETLSNNLANAQTPGFKKDDTVMRAFPKLLVERIRDYNETIPGANGLTIPGQGVPVGELANGVYAQERIPSFLQGALVQTDQPLDIAIDDQNIPLQVVNGRTVKPTAFFAVELPDGSVGYTRNGKWDLDSNGNLVTSDGYKILGADHKPIQVTGGVSKDDLYIDANGQVIANPNDVANARQVGQIGMVVVQNPYDLTRQGGNVYKSENPLPFIQDAGGTNPGVTLHQGYVEQSNVDPGQTMADMMMTVRAYEANQKVVSVYNQSLEQLYSVGKING